MFASLYNNPQLSTVYDQLANYIGKQQIINDRSYLNARFNKIQNIMDGPIKMIEHPA